MATPLSLRMTLAWPLLLLLGWGHPAATTAITTATPNPIIFPPPTTCAAPGQVHSVEVPTQHLSAGHIEALLYLPPCFDPAYPGGYPLLVLLHGQSYTPQQWLDMNLPQRADRLIAAGLAPPFLVLMPYEPPPALRPEHTGFDEALMQDMLPWLEAHYPVRRERAYRAIGGISRGGAWALNLGLRYWQQFGAIGGHSPAVFWSDGLQIPTWFAAIPQHRWPRVYIDIGDGDRQEIGQAARELERILTDLGVPHQWHLNVGRHEQTYWNAHLDDYLAWYTGAWAAPSFTLPPEVLP